AQRKFIDTIFPVDNQRMLAAEVQQYLTHFSQKRAICNTQYLIGRMGGVGQWAEDIEYRANTDFATCWANMLHGGMIGRRKHKAKAHFLYAMCHLLWPKINTRP